MNSNDNKDSVVCHDEEEKDDNRIDLEIEQVRLELDQIRLRYSCHTQEEEKDEEDDDEEKTNDDHDDNNDNSGNSNNSNNCNSKNNNTNGTTTTANTTYLNLFLQLEQLRDEYELVRSNYQLLLKEGRSDGRTVHLYTDAIMKVYESRQQQQQQQQQDSKNKNNSKNPSLIGLETQVVRSFHQICNLDIQHQLCYQQSKDIIKYMESTLSQMYDLKSKEETQHLTTLMDMSKAMDEQSKLYQNLWNQSTKSCDLLRKSVEATQSLHSFLMPVAATVKKSSVNSSSPSAPSPSLSTRPRRTKQPPQPQDTTPQTSKQNKENRQSSSTRSLQPKKKKTLRPSKNRNIKQQKRLSSLTKSIAPDLTFVEHAHTTTSATTTTTTTIPHSSTAAPTTPRRSNNHTNHNTYHEEHEREEHNEEGDQTYGSISIPDKRHHQKHGKDAKDFSPHNDNASTVSTTSSLTMDVPVVVTESPEQV